MGDSYEVQPDTDTGVSSGGGSAPLEPLYFMMGFIAGLIFVSLFKGRWFL